MRRKYIAAAFLIFLVVVLLLSGAWFFRSSPNNVVRMLALDKLAVLSVVVGEAGGYSLRFDCKDSPHCPYLDGFHDLPLSSGWERNVEFALKALAGIPPYNLEGEREGSRDRRGEDFGFLETSNRFVFVNNDGPEETLFIGSRNDFLHSYYATLDLDEDAPLFLVPENLLSVFSVSRSEMLDSFLVSSLHSFQFVNRIVLTSGAQDPIVLEAVHGEWSLVGDGEADAPFVMELLSVLKTLQFSDVSTEDAHEEREGRFLLEVIVQGTLHDGHSSTEVVTIRDNEAKSGEYLARRGDSPYLFRLKALPRMLVHLRREQVAKIES